MENEKVMTLGIFAHANAGKTTITENLLYDTNVINTIGRVDTKNTVTDSMDIEKQRGITVRSSLVSFNAEGTKVQLIDTPGHVDFSAEVERAINVLDGAVLVISGVEGVEAQTYTIWNALKNRGVPTCFFINKLDRDGSDYERVLDELRKKLNVPIVSLERIKKDNNGFNIERLEKEELIEQLSAIDKGVDDLIEKYLYDQKSISGDEVEERIEKLSKNGTVNVAIGGSGLKSKGIEELVHIIANYLPETKKDLEDDFSAYVYALRVDDNMQKNAYVKVLSGEINVRDKIKNNDDYDDKIKNLYISDGKEVINTLSLKSGDIGVITGINARCGELLGENKNEDKYLSFVNPLISMEVNAKCNEEVPKLIDALNILNEEDPYLNVRYSKEVNKIYVSLMGEVQAEVIQEMLKNRFGIDAVLTKPMIIHKERPAKEASGEAFYTRVSGVMLEIKPLPEGSGFKYKSKLSTDVLHKKYQRQTERLVNQYAKQGLYGWEITDAEVDLVDGKFDSMGSEPKHFNIIVPLALTRALKDADMQVLEPISSYSLIIPKNSLKSVIELLSKKRSKFEIDSMNDENVKIIGEAPLDKMVNFPIELNKVTSGMGIFSQSVSKYELAKDQNKECPYVGPDPRNETLFIINDMGASLDALDPIKSKSKKTSKSKYKKEKMKKQIREEKKDESYSKGERD